VPPQEATFLGYVVEVMDACDLSMDLPTIELPEQVGGEQVPGALHTGLATSSITRQNCHTSSAKRACCAELAHGSSKYVCVSSQLTQSPRACCCGPQVTGAALDTVLDFLRVNKDPAIASKVTIRAGPKQSSSSTCPSPMQAWRQQTEQRQ
jgi:hypothetical protein